MKKIATLIIALCLCGTTLWAQDGGPFGLIGADEPLPAFSVEMSDGTTLNSKSFEGKIVWITLWASWCPSCRKEFKALSKMEEFSALLNNKEFLFLPIAREEERATVVAWLKKKGYPYLSGIDADRSVYNLFAIEEIPRNIIVGRDGTILYHNSGGVKKELRTLTAICTEQLTE